MPTASTSAQFSSFVGERLSRIITPRPGEPLDVRSLYLVEASTNPRRCHAPSRTSLRIPADSEVSFETYFNGLPASYWRRWSTLTSVVLRLHLTGSGRVDTYRSKIDGSRIGITGVSFCGPEGDGATAATTAPHTLDPQVTQCADGSSIVELTLGLEPFEDGGWLWFDITADTPVELLEGGWYAPVAAPTTVTYTDQQTGLTHEVDNANKVVIGIPTFNRPNDAVAALQALASDPDVDAIIEAVLMPDQGTKKVIDHPDFASAAAHFGIGGGVDGATDAAGQPLSVTPDGRFFRFEQGNLGGSGGYSRIMYEARQHTTAPFILYMDDDIAIEPDSILRAVAFARFAKQPMLVGGQMLNLQERSHLHSMGEVVNRADFMWTSAPHVHYDHDFSQYPLSAARDHRGAQHTGLADARWQETADLHRRIDVDYNGWWMCLIPRLVADTIGQPLPLFIKWDDAEFGLRAGAHGFPTVTMPGIAIWHMAWSDKDDAIDWQAYFHLRNRLVVAALTQPEGASINGMLASMAKAVVKHTLCLEYSTVAIQIEAIKDFLRGPDALFDLLPTALPKVAALRREFPDAVVLRSASDLPAPSGGPGGVTEEPRGIRRKVTALAKGLLHSVRPANPAHHSTPQMNLPPIDARWYSLSRLDGATVTTADGRGVVYRQRDLDKAKQLVKDSFAMHKQLREKWAEMQRQYRAAHPRLTSLEAWSEIFGPDTLG